MLNQVGLIDSKCRKKKKVMSGWAPVIVKFFTERKR